MILLVYTAGLALKQHHVCPFKLSKLNSRSWTPDKRTVGLANMNALC